MTARDPGTPDLAYATVRGVPDVLVMSSGPHWWATAVEVDCYRFHSATVVTDIVPARAVPETHVVLDPESLERAARRLAELMPLSWGLFQSDDPEVGEDSVRCFEVALRTFAAEQSRPPLAEPGPWGVVEAGFRGPITNGARSHWLHGPEGWSGPDGDDATWADLIDPVLVRPGLDDEAES